MAYLSRRCLGLVVSVSAGIGMASLLRLRAIAFFRRPDQGPKGRAEGPSLYNKPLIVERRSLDCAALRTASLGTTEITIRRRRCDCVGFAALPVRTAVFANRRAPVSTSPGKAGG